MAFKITNNLRVEDYDNIISGMKNGSGACIFNNCQLEKPLFSISPIYAVPRDNTYRIWGVLYPDSSKIALKVCGRTKDSLADKYTVRGKDDNFHVMSENLRYHITHENGGSTKFVSSDNPLDPKILETDVDLCFDILEISINSAYGNRKKKEIPAFSTLRISKDINEQPEQECVSDNYLVSLIKKEDVRIGFGDIGGCEEAKNKLLRFAFGLKNPEAYKKLGLRQPKGIMLYGPPGTGKTLLAKATAKEIDANFYNVEGSKILDMWLGESEKNVKEMFEIAKENAPAILFIDEIDSLFSVRGSASDALAGVVGTLLGEMDGITELKEVMVMAATNRLDVIDSALLRPGRFDEKIEVPLPDEVARKQIYQVRLKGRRVMKKIDYDALAKSSNEFSGADIEGSINLMLGKMVDDIRKGLKPKPLSTENLLEGAKEYRKSVEKLTGSSIKGGEYLYV